MLVLDLDHTLLASTRFSELAPGQEALLVGVACLVVVEQMGSDSGREGGRCRRCRGWRDHVDSQLNGAWACSPAISPYCQQALVPQHRQRLTARLSRTAWAVQGQRLEAEAGSLPDARRELYRSERLGVWTKLRPGAREFLARAEEMFEVWVRSAGSR